MTGETSTAGKVMPLTTGPAVPVGGPALPLRELARRLEIRKWACELVRDGDDTVLRVRAPDAGDDPKRTVEIVVRERDRRPYFAYAKTPERLLAAVDDFDRAISALDLVHGSEPHPPPPVPEGLARAAAEWADEMAPGGAFP